jgi:hypothetical protein
VKSLHLQLQQNLFLLRSQRRQAGSLPRATFPPNKWVKDCEPTKVRCTVIAAPKVSIWIGDSGDQNGEAELGGANLSKADLSKVDLSEANLRLHTPTAVLALFEGNPIGRQAPLKWQSWIFHQHPGRSGSNAQFAARTAISTKCSLSSKATAERS